MRPIFQSAISLAIIFLALHSFAQSSGDYQSNAATGNWTTVAWQKYNGSAWVTATDYPGQNTGAGTVTIQDGHDITLDVSPANAIGAFVVGEGTSGIFKTSANNRTLNVTNGLTVKAGASFNLRRITITVGTNTLIDGTLTDNHDNGSATFNGTFTVGSTGSVSTANTSAFTFVGAITNNGTIDLTGGGTLIIRNGITNNNTCDIGAVTFNTTNNQTIAGSAATTFSGIVTVTGITVINNNSDLNLTNTSNNSITGTGTWEQGATGVLKFSGGSMNITAVDFDASGNTVNYTQGGNQTIRLSTYHHLSVSTSGTKTLGGAITVNGNLAVTTTSTTTLACDIYQITGNASGTFTMASGTTMTLGNTGNATNVLFPSNFTNANTTLNSASTVTYQNNSTQTVSSTPTYGNLTIATGSTKTLNGNLSVGGNLTISAGTFDLGTTATTISITGTATVTGTLTFSGTTTKAVSIGGNLSGAGTINMSGGSLPHTLNLGGTTNAITTFTTAAAASTVNYNASADQQIFSSANYRSLTISGSGIKTLAGTATVNNNLSISGSATLASDIYQITGNASGTFSMAAGTTLTLGRTSSATNILFPSNFTTGNCSLNSTSTVIYQNNSTQTVSGTPVYGNLTIATSNTKTLGAAVTVNGNLAITGTATLATSTFQITGNASGTFTMASGTTLTLGNTGNATNVLFPTNFTAGNISLNSASTVTYQNNSTQTVSNTPTYGNLTIATGSTKTLNGNVTIGGNLTISAGTFDLGTTATTVDITGTATVTGILSFNGTTTKTVTITGDLSGAGTINMSGGSLLHTLNLGGATNAITTFTTVAVASTVNYTRAGNQTVFGSANYRSLSTSGSGTKSQGGAVTVGNTFTIGSGTTYDPAGFNITVNGNSVFAGTLAESNATGTNNFQNVDLSGGSINGSVTDVTNINGDLTMPSGNATLGRTTLTVFGTTTIADGRSLTINNSTGVKTFRGAVVINGSGSWTSTIETNAADLVFWGGIDVASASGSFTAGGATFSNNAQNITGAGPISFADAVSISGAIIITNTNTAGVTFNNTVTGTVAGSTWRNGTNGVTYYKPAATTSPMSTGTLDVSSSGNQFHYSRAGAQDIKVPATSYHHLYISGGSSSVKTLLGTISVGGDLYIAGSTSLQPATFDLTATAGTTTIAGTLVDNSVTGTTSLLNTDLSGGTIDGSATGVVNITGNLTMPTGNGTIGRMTLTVSGTTTIATGRTLTFNANSNTGVKRFNDDITLNGTGAWTSTNILTAANLDLRGGIDVVSASGNFAAGAATFNATQSITGAGPITFANAVSVTGAITVTNTNTYGVTFNNIIDGTVAGSTWANGVGGIVNYQPGATTQPMNTGALDASGTGNYYYYSRAGNQNIKAPSTSYYHLHLTGGSSGVKTLQGSTIVSGNLNVAASTSVDASSFNFSITGTSTLNGTFNDGNSTGTNTFTGLVTVSSTGTLSTANASPFVFEGGITNNGTFNQSGTGAVSFNTNDQDIDGTATMSFAGAITIGAGRTVTYKNTNATGIMLTGVLNGANASSTWKNEVNATVYYQPAATTQPMNTGILDVSASGNNFHYSRTTGAQTVKTPSSAYHNLIISGAGGIIKTLAGNTTVNGNLTIAASTTLDVDNAQNYSLTLKGNFLNSGTFQAGSGTVTLNGSSNQAVTSNSSSFYNLAIANTATQVSLNDNLTVSNLLTLTDGVITTGGSYRVIVSNSSAASVGGYSSSSFVNGNLRRYIGTNTDTYVFPVGNGTGTSTYYQADMINNSLTGISYIDSKFKPLTGHNDNELIAFDLWENGALDYTTINTAGVWELEPNAAPSGGSYNIKLYIANMDGFTDNNFGPLKRPVGSTSGADWSTGGSTLNNDDSPGRTIAGGYMQRNGLTTFSEFGGGGGTSGGAGLPIELISFTTIAKEDHVEIKWTTATEINNDFFIVERSKDAITFETLNVIVGAGNSSESLEYLTYDRNPFSGTSYYRLTQVDYDGKYTYSDIVSVYMAPLEISFVVSPNPVTGNNFSIQMENTGNETTSGNSTISLFDLSGKEIFSTPLDISQKRQSFELPLEIAKGIYLLVVNHSGNIIHQKLTVN